MLAPIRSGSVYFDRSWRSPSGLLEKFDISDLNRIWRAVFR